MDMWILAKKLYSLGYTHRQIRRVWAYAWNEQHIGQSGRKRKAWEGLALEQAGVLPTEVEFPDRGNYGDVSNYF